MRPFSSFDLRVLYLCGLLRIGLLDIKPQISRELHKRRID